VVQLIAFWIWQSNVLAVNHYVNWWITVAIVYDLFFGSIDRKELRRSWLTCVSCLWNWTEKCLMKPRPRRWLGTWRICSWLVEEYDWHWCSRHFHYDWSYIPRSFWKIYQFTVRLVILVINMLSYLALAEQNVCHICHVSLYCNNTGLTRKNHKENIFYANVVVILPIWNKFTICFTAMTF